MNRRSRLVWYYLAIVAAVIAMYTAAYDIGMSVFEGRPRDPVHAFEVVLQTLTTTGFGQDAPWTSTEMTLLVILIQFSSVVLVFAALPVIVIPLFENVFTRSPPTAAEGADDHVIVAGANDRAEALIDELTSRGVEHALVVSDRESATEYDDRGYTVVHGELDAEQTLERAGLREAQALVADVGDEENLSITIAAKMVAPDVPVYSVVDDSDYAGYHRHAGADEVFSPRRLLGEGLASKVTTTVSIEADGIVGTDRVSAELAEVEVAELPMSPESDLAGQQIDATDLEDRFGAAIIGAWVSGEFMTPPLSDLRLDEHTTLLAVGDHRQILQLKQFLQAEARSPGRGDVVVLGHGAVGSIVTEALDEAGVPTTVVDLDAGPGVDIVGDATDKDVLAKAGITAASGLRGHRVVVALDDDLTALVATFVIRDISPNVAVVVRANRVESVRKFYHAGANHVLSLAAVSGRLLASNILRSDEVLTYDNRVRLVRRSPGALAGQPLQDMALRERTGCTAIGVHRADGPLDTDPPLDMELEPDDALIIAGTDPNLERFDELAAGEGGD